MLEGKKKKQRIKGKGKAARQKKNAGPEKAALGGLKETDSWRRNCGGEGRAESWNAWRYSSRGPIKNLARPIEILKKPTAFKKRGGIPYGGCTYG